MTDETGWVTVYDTETGEIDHSGCARRNKPVSVIENRATTPGDIPGDIYWINPETGRKNLRRDVTLAISGNRIAAIPEHCWVTINGHRVDPVDGEVVVGVDLPEDVEVMLGGPRVRPKRLTVTCEPGATVEPGPGKIVLAQDYAALRRRAYAAAGLTVEAITFAQLDGDAAEVARITAARAAIKARIPKRKAP